MKKYFQISADGTEYFADVFEIKKNIFKKLYKKKIKKKLKK